MINKIIPVAHVVSEKSTRKYTKSFNFFNVRVCVCFLFFFCPSV